MDMGIYEIAGLITVIVILIGIKLMSSPETAALGNRLGAISMLAAIVFVMWHNRILDGALLFAAMGIGALIGIVLAFRVAMIQMPQMVALLNGLGGGASMLVALVVIFEKHAEMDLYNRVAGQLALVVGAVTLSGSIIAAGKLQHVLPQKPVVIRGQSFISPLVLTALLALCVAGSVSGPRAAATAAITVTLLALAYGVLLTLPIGGADMPIAISLLNSYSGVAASICGFAISDVLLVAIGAIVGSAGLILTQIMCRAMNRTLGDILTGRTTVRGITPAPGSAACATPAPDPAQRGDSVLDPVAILDEARSVIIIPGYGMAVAQAQPQVKALYDLLVSRGKDVRFAIHPVAGRMPGHMNVLLAEVDVPYEKLVEMDVINPEFASTDAVLIVGACDVVNPAANSAEGTPIYGMPILEADSARHVIVCNMDTRPGYSGVDNPLYTRSNTCLLMGDAVNTLQKMLDNLAAMHT